MSAFDSRQKHIKINVYQCDVYVVWKTVAAYLCRTFQCAVSLFLIILSRPRAKLQYVCKWQLALLQLDIHRMLCLAALTGLISIENCS